MYINFWYPVCTAEELSADEPLQVQLLGLKFVAFRDTDGKPHVLSDTCIHRGGSLGFGKIKGDCVECPYHGWQFAGDGRCTHIPSEGDAKPPARAKIDAYPTEERYGMSWVFMGDIEEKDRYPIPPFPELGGAGQVYECLAPGASRSYRGEGLED